MPLPLTVSCFNKIQIGFTFLVPADPGSPGKRAVIRVCDLGTSLSSGHTFLEHHRVHSQMPVFSRGCLFPRIVRTDVQWSEI